MTLNRTTNFIFSVRYGLDWSFLVFRRLRDCVLHSPWLKGSEHHRSRWTLQVSRPQTRMHHASSQEVEKSFNFPCLALGSPISTLSSVGIEPRSRSFTPFSGQGHPFLILLREGLDPDVPGFRQLILTRFTLIKGGTLSCNLKETM